MFGYIKPCVPELKVREEKLYKGIYCGLCGQLGKLFGPIARLTLSYDFTFLCMLGHGVSNIPFEMEKHRCYVNPFKKKMCICKENDMQVFSANVAVIMVYYNLLDNIQDSGFFKRCGYKTLYPIVASAYKKAATAQPIVDDIVRESIAQQAAVEKEKSDSIDRACDPSASLMSQIFPLLCEDESAKRVLQRLGYLIGRYVYLCDALDDIESDEKSGNYNPVVLYGISQNLSAPARIQKATDSLYLTIGEIEKTYTLLEINPLKSILDNIIYLGLKASVDNILVKKGEGK